MKPEVYLMPEEINTRIAEIKLASMEILIDKLTPEQKKYLDEA